MFRCVLAYYEEAAGRNKAKIYLLEAKDSALSRREDTRILSQPSQCTLTLPEGLLVSLSGDILEVLDIWSGGLQRVRLPGNLGIMCAMQPAMDKKVWQQIMPKQHQSPASMLLRMLCFVE